MPRNSVKLAVNRHLLVNFRVFDCCLYPSKTVSCAGFGIVESSCADLLDQNVSG